MKVLVWNEGVHERSDARMAEYYPDGIHGAIAAGLREALPGSTVRAATLADPDQGLSSDVLDGTDVLIWWGHVAHEEVDDARVAYIHDRVLSGMGIIVLHSGHFSKIFTRLTGTTCSLRWRNEGERELVWSVMPTHPIAQGISSPIVIDRQEMYGEFFDIPAPEELIFLSSFAGGEVFRSGITYRRGHGKVFYFSPGDERYPVYNHPQIRRILANAVNWAIPEKALELPVVSNPEVDWFVESETL